MITNHFTYHFTNHVITAVRQVFTPVTTAYVKMTDTHALRAYQYRTENGEGRGGGLPWKLQ
mgnify:CR=1 FL=1|jgi:hypothetical protein